MSRSAEKLGRLGQFRLESHLCFFLRFSSIDRDLRYRSNGHDRIDEWSIDRVIDDWNEQKIYYFYGLESRNHESRLFNVLSTRINLDRKVRLTLWKSKCYFKIKYVHLTGITSASPFHEFRTPIYRIDYVNVKVPFWKVITRLPRVLRMIFRMNKHFIFFTHEKLTHFF